MSTTTIVHGLGYAAASIGYAHGTQAHLSVGDVNFILASDRSTVEDLNRVRGELRRLAEAIDQADEWLLQRREILMICADRRVADFGDVLPDAAQQVAS